MRPELGWSGERVWFHNQIDKVLWQTKSKNGIDLYSLTQQAKLFFFLFFIWVRFSLKDAASAPAQPTTRRRL